jgi:hypothetical protein
MKSPETLLAGDGIGLHEEIEEMFSGHAQGGNLPPRKTPIRLGDPELCPRSGRIIKPGAADTNAAHEPDTWRPKKGDKPPKDGPLTLSQVLEYAQAQYRKWSNELTKAKQLIDDPLDEKKKPINLEPVQALGLLAEQARHFIDLLRRLKPENGIPSSDTAAKPFVNKLLSAIPKGASVISTADAVRVLVPGFPDLFDGAASLRAAGKRLRGLLLGLGIFTRNMRINGQVVKGYRVADLRKTVV